MKRSFSRIIVLIEVVFFLAASSSSSAQISAPYNGSYSNPKTLLESLALAFKLNPKTRSKELALAAMSEQTKAVQAHALPSGSFTCSRTYDYSRTYVNGSYVGSGQLRGGTCQVGLSVNVYDGGAHKAEVQSAQLAEEAKRQLYSSNNPLVLNTKGFIANQITSAYFRMVFNKSHKARALYHLDIFKKALKVSPGAGEQEELKSKILSTKNSILTFDLNIEKAAMDFEYWVTTKPDDNLEDLTKTVNSLWVPSSAEEALNIAKQKSPDIKTTAAGLGVEEKMLEGLKARLGPQVYLNYSYGLSRYWPDFQSRGGTWAVVLTIPFGASSAHAIRAQKLSVEAAKLEKESAIEDIFQRLKHSYLTLERGLKNSELSSAQFRESEKNLTSLVGELTDGPLEKNLVTRVKAMVESDSNTFGFLLGLQADIFWSKFEIQQAMGLLFEQVKGNQ